MDQLALIIGSIVVPLCAFFGNLMIRNLAKIPSTAGADIVLFLLTLDATVLISNEEFKTLVKNSSIQIQFIPIFVGFLFLSLLLWIANITHFETKVIKSFNPTTGIYTNYPFAWVLFSWFLIAILTCSHFLIFSLKNL